MKTTNLMSLLRKMKQKQEHSEFGGNWDMRGGWRNFGRQESMMKMYRNKENILANVGGREQTSMVGDFLANVSRLLDS